jgi:hypothetical protein
MLSSRSCFSISSTKTNKKSKQGMSRAENSLGGNWEMKVCHSWVLFSLWRFPHVFSPDSPAAWQFPDLRVQRVGMEVCHEPQGKLHQPC